jgi:hypothetical protein
VQSIKRLIKRFGSNLLYQKQIKRQTYLSLLDKISKVSGLPLSKASADVFTYHGEDGIIQFILKHLQNVPPVFVDIGSGDCIKSNCAVPAVHQNWSGIFIDTDRTQLGIGKAFYKRLGKKNLIFENAYVTPANVNQLIETRGFSGAVGLLSIDIDGNDYWIWKAIEVIQPLMVIVEAKVEFSRKDLVVPYSKSNHHSFHPMYNGASVEAFKRLGQQKGYTLIGANLQGYNLFFLPSHLVVSPFYPAETKELLNVESTQKSFYPESFFREHEFITSTDAY